LLGIPHVTSSSTFTEDDWFQMRRIASQLWAGIEAGHCNYKDV
jgi:hypothetical protein